MSKHSFARYVVFGCATLTLAAYGAHAKRERAMAAEQVGSGSYGFLQMPNRGSKTDSLLVRTALTRTPVEPTYTVASLEPTAPPTAAADEVFAPQQTMPDASALAAPAPESKAAPESKPAATPAPNASPEAKTPDVKTPDVKAAAAKTTEPLPAAKSESKIASLAAHAAEKIAEKARKLVPQPQVQAAAHPAAGGLLDDSQISGLKARLRLTDDQVGYWPAVEDALRNVVRTQIRGRGAHPSIDVNSAEVQQLVWAAMPLLMRLREDQKGEVRKLARVLGLEQVASQI